MGGGDSVNGFRDASKVGAYRARLLEGGVGSIGGAANFSQGLLQSSSGAGANEQIKQISRADDFLNKSLDAVQSSGQAWTQNAAEAGSQGMSAIAAQRQYLEAKRAAEAAQRAKKQSGILGIIKNVGAIAAAPFTGGASLMMLG